MATSLELAITAIRSGRKEEGRQLLNLLIQQNPNNEMAWLWMSSVVENDEQRARCLYHVLAIDPENAVARQGLKVLGIVVSDSRPVKVPRDSQPINIPKPSQRLQTGPLKALPTTTSQTQSTPDERRPFALDPEAIAAELPFKPITSPFKPDPAEDDSASSGRGKPQPKKQTGSLPKPAEPVWVKRAKNAPSPKRQTGPLNGQPDPAPFMPMNSQPRRAPQIVHQQGQPVPRPQPINGIKLKIAPRQIPQTGPLSQPSSPVQPPTSASGPPSSSPPPPRLGQTEPMVGASVPPLQNPSEPVPVAQNNPPAQSSGYNNGHNPPAAVNTSNQQPWPNQSAPPHNGGQGYGYGSPPSFSNTPAAHETRPTQPMATPPAMNPTLGMPIYYQNNQPPYGLHANATMGMPPQQQHAPLPPHSHALAAMHAQSTIGMPPQASSPSEPMPIFHSNTTMGMPPTNYLQTQQPAPYPAVHSNSTMAMPTNQANLVDYRAVNAPPPLRRDVEEEEEGLNILAVIIFGSLSVTALGGLGMLILLMFTGN